MQYSNELTHASGGDLGHTLRAAPPSERNGRHVHRADLAHWTRWHVGVTGMQGHAGRGASGAAVAQCLRESAAFRGRIIGLDFFLPDPALGPLRLLEDLRNLMRHERIDAILPCGGAETANFAAIAPQLRQMGVRIMLPDAAALRRYRGAYLGTQSAAPIGVPGVALPRCGKVADLRFFDRMGEPGEAPWSFPLIIESPIYGSVVVHDADQARRRAMQLATLGGYPLQVRAYVAGTDFRFAALGDDSGTPMGHVVLQETPNHVQPSAAFSGVSVKNEEIVELSTRLMRELCWRGPAELHFRRNLRGEVFLLDIAARFPAWVGLPHSIGRASPITLLALLQEVLPAQIEFAPDRAGVPYVGGPLEHTASTGPRAIFSPRAPAAQ